jgi:hypothetical protein
VDADLQITGVRKQSVGQCCHTLSSNPREKDLKEFVFTGQAVASAALLVLSKDFQKQQTEKNTTRIRF